MNLLTREYGMDKLRALATLSTDDLVEGLQRNPHASDVWRNLSDVDLGAGNAALYKRWSDTDPESPLHLNALTPKEFEHFGHCSRGLRAP